MDDNPSRPKLTALDRARQDLAAGRPDRARERVTGYLYTMHCRGAYSQEAYLLLGEIHFAMRDYIRAGAAWLLTEKQGSEAETAFAAFYERYGRSPVNVLRAVKPRAPSEDYPPSVQERLKAWDYRYRVYRARSNPHGTEEPAPPTRGVRPVEVGCVMATILFLMAVAYWLYLIMRGR